jgi:hypothetical protein
MYGIRVGFEFRRAIVFVIKDGCLVFKYKLKTYWAI